MFFGPSFPGCGVYPLVVDNFCVLGPGLGWLRCVTAIMSRGRELSGSWLPGTHQPVKVSQPLSSQLILGATGDWGWLWADIWPLSPLQVHVMCHVTSSAALLTLQVSATVSCFFLAPGLVTLAWCQICPPPGELLELLTVSRLTRLATKVRSASGSREMTGASGGESNDPRRQWIISEDELERWWPDYTHNVDWLWIRVSHLRQSRALCTRDVRIEILLLTDRVLGWCEDVPRVGGGQVRARASPVCRPLLAWARARVSSQSQSRSLLRARTIHAAFAGATHYTHLNVIG